MVKVSLILCGLILSACRGINFEPERGDGPAVVPAAGSEFVYSYKATGALDSTTEHTSFVLLDGRNFIAVQSEALATARDTFRVRDDGDLESQSFDVIFPIKTQSSYTMTTSTPVIRNGSAYIEAAVSDFKFEGTDRLKVADTSFLCSRIGRTLSIMPSNSNPGLSAKMTYWYSSKAGYFVMVRSESSTNPEMNYERRLIAIK